MFLRADLGYVDAMNYTKSDVFGSTGALSNQFRGVLEFGFIFGKNVTEK
jgi:hypothetical protein